MSHIHLSVKWIYFCLFSTVEESNWSAYLIPMRLCVGFLYIFLLGYLLCCLLVICPPLFSFLEYSFSHVSSRNHENKLIERLLIVGSLLNISIFRKIVLLSSFSGSLQK